MTTFSDLNLDPRLQRALSEHFNFSTLLPIQKHCIPKLINESKDLVAQAITGSGKTLAFLIPILQKLLLAEAAAQNSDNHEKKYFEKSGIPKIHTVILSPTRELAIQIRNVCQNLAKFIEGFNCLCLTTKSKKASSNKNKNQQVSELELIADNKANIIIATPGKLSDIIEKSGDSSTSLLRRALKNIEFLIIDEADRVLSDNFKQQIDEILPCLAKQRRTSLFSATLEKEQEVLIPMLARAGLRNPIRVVVKETFQQIEEENNENANTNDDNKVVKKEVKKIVNENTPNLLNSYYLRIKKGDLPRKFDILINLLRSKKKEKCLVFFTTCAQVDYFGKTIKAICGKYMRVFETHGKTNKDKRETVFEEFTNYKKGSILVCTDIMARGVDFPNVNWVIQFDIPQNAENFVHRCGRTARAGNNGNSVVFLMDNELDYVNFLKINQNIKELQELKIQEIEKDLTEEEKKKINIGTATLAQKSKTDRRNIELSTKAYVSFVQAYSKHEQNVLVRTKDLDFGKLATAYVLFQVPRMPELKNRETTNFESRFGKRILEDIPYKDKSIRKDREKRNELRKIQREKELAEAEEKGEEPLKKRPFYGKLGNTKYIVRENQTRDRNSRNDDGDGDDEGDQFGDKNQDKFKGIHLKKKYVPKHAKAWSESKAKEELRKKRKQERMARKEYKKSQLEQKPEVPVSV